MNFFRRIFDAVFAFIKKGIENEIPVRAASLTFSSVLSIVPFLAIMISLLSRIEAVQSVASRVVDFLLQNIVPSATGSLRTAFMSFSQNAQSLPIFGFIWLFISSSSLFIDLDSFSQKLWGIRKGRPIYRTLLLFWAGVIGGPILIGLAFFLNGAVAQLIHKTFHASENLIRFGPTLSYVATYVLVLMILLLLPNRRVPRLPALLVAGLCFLGMGVLKFFFTLSFGQFTNVQTLYGSLAIVPLFFSWIYFNWYWILLCVQLLAMVADRKVVPTAAAAL